MTNPHGYYDTVREELLIEDENSAVQTERNYDRSHKDINRDFPYLTNPDKCMETIGARVVNELFTHHLFSLSLSLHGGTESLTYPYGTPNHLKSNQVPKLTEYYNKPGPNERFQVRETKDTPHKLMEKINKYRSGKYDLQEGESTNAPDFNAITDIAKTATDHTTNNEKYKYKIGNMNGAVYTVVGGMEDWAYSGSWEGAPIITQPCEPTTYNGYDKDKTNYDQNYKDALKSIMFLLEVSDEKIPQDRLLGVENIDCLINLRSNAFFNKLAHNKKTCLDSNIDGYIPRIIRLSLTLIDILNPYINVKIENNTSADGQDSALVRWAVGGAITVNRTFLLFQYFKKQPDEVYLQQIKDANSIKALEKLLNQNTKYIKNKKGVWDVNYTAKDIFVNEFKLGQKNINNKYLVFVAVAEVDKNWSKKNDPDPDVNPQTHIANLRNDPNYTAKNAGFELKGQNLFKSDVMSYDFSTSKKKKFSS